MNSELNKNILAFVEKMDADGKEQLQELFNYFSKLDKGNRLEILQHAKLYHDATALMKLSH